MDTESNSEFHRKAIALVICFIIAFFYVETTLKPWLRKDEIRKEQIATQSGTEESPQVAGSEAAGEGSPSAVATGVGAGSPSGIVVPDETVLDEVGSVQISNGKIQAEISLLGGRVRHLKLLEYPTTKSDNSEPLELIDHLDDQVYPLGVRVGKQRDIGVRYTLQNFPESSSFENIQEETQLSFSGVLPGGEKIEKLLRFYPDSYVIDVEVRTSAEKQPIRVEWTRYVEDGESSMLDPGNTQDFTWFSEGSGAERLSVGDLEVASKPVGAVRWLSLANKYFMAALISPLGSTQASIKKDGKTYIASVTQPEAGALKLFVGPKKHDVLEAQGLELERNINFGMFGFISVPLLRMLQLLYGIMGNYGLAVVTLTILVRLALYPLNATSFKTMKKMQALKPDLDRIKQNEDKQAAQMQMMALYKKEGVNPLGGCLPMLMQFPIFLGLYYALMLAVELRHAEFTMWINDLSSPEWLMLGSIGIPVLVLLWLLSMVAQQLTMPSQMDPAQKKMMMVMPVVLSFMFVTMPSGLVLYWLTSNLITIGQQKGLHLAHDDGKSALKITLTVSLIVFVTALVLSFF